MIAGAINRHDLGVDDVPVLGDLGTEGPVVRPDLDDQINSVIGRATNLAIALGVEAIPGSKEGAEEVGIEGVPENRAAGETLSGGV
jgi:hypothetical protein